MNECGTPLEMFCCCGEVLEKNATVVVCRQREQSRHRRQSAPEAMKFAGKRAHFSFNRFVLLETRQLAGKSPMLYA